MKLKIQCEKCHCRAKSQFIKKGQKVCGKHFSKEQYDAAKNN